MGKGRPIERKNDLPRVACDVLVATADDVALKSSPYRKRRHRHVRLFAEGLSTPLFIFGPKVPGRNRETRERGSGSVSLGSRIYVVCSRRERWGVNGTERSFQRTTCSSHFGGYTGRYIAKSPAIQDGTTRTTRVGRNNKINLKRIETNDLGM